MKTTLPLIAVLGLGYATLLGQTAPSGSNTSATPPAPTTPQFAPTTGTSTNTTGSTVSTSTGGSAAGAINVAANQPPGATGQRPSTVGPNANASATAKAVHQTIAEFQVQREKQLADRKKLTEKLKTATADERKVILEQLREQNEARASEERALGKQIREELKTQRPERAPKAGS
jgi:hypothetical protein